MDDRYDNIARLLAGAARSGQPHPSLLDLKYHSGLGPEAMQAALEDLKARGWAGPSANGMHMVLTSAGKDRVGEDAHELLAFDIAEWIRENGHRQFAVADLPDRLREDELLLELALGVLEGFGAARILASRGRPHEVMVQAGIRLFGRTVDTPRMRPLVQIHEGDIVGGDKNTVHSSGTIVTGSRNTVSQQVDAGGSFATLVDELRKSGQVSPQAIDVLETAAANGRSMVGVAGVTEEAIAVDAGLVEKLQGWIDSVTSSAAGSALYEGIKFAVIAYLASKGPKL